MVFLRRLKLFLFNGIILTFTSIFLQFIGVSFGVYISNRIGKEAVGLYQLLMSVYSFGLTLALSGINLTCMRLISEELAKSSLGNVKGAMKKCLIYSLLFGLLAFLLISLSANLISSSILHNKISISTICIMALALPFVSICSCINGYFSAVRHVIKSSLLQIVEQFFRIFVVTYLLNYVFTPSINSACLSIVFGSTVSEVLTCICTIILYLHESKKHTKTKVYFPAKNILRISLPISFTSYIRSGLSTLKQVLVPLKLESFGLSCNVALSQYGLINGMVLPIILFPSTFLNSFSGLLIPEFSSFNVKQEKETIKKSIEKIFKYTIFFSFFVVGFFFCFSDNLSVLIYKNIEISIYIKILAPIIIFMYLDNIVDGILKGLDKQVSVMIINIIDLISSIIFICILLPMYGIIGYLIVLFISEILNALLSIWVLIDTTKIKFNYKNLIIKPIFVVFFSVILTNIFKFDTYSVFFLILNGLVFTIFYFLFSFMLNLISKKDFKF